MRRALAATGLVAALVVVAGVATRQPDTAHAAARADAAVVWFAADNCDNRTAPVDCGDVARLVADDPASDAFLAGGDLQYDDGTLSEFTTWYQPRMGVIRGITRPVPGNHEYHTPGAAGYFDYWGAKAGSRSRGYYSFTIGGWRIVAGNSNCSRVGGCDPSSPQGGFVATELAKPETCELVFAHHPGFSDGPHGDEAAGRSMFRLAYNGRADLYLAGHDHDYQRFTPKRPDGTTDVARGTRSFVVGTGGAELTPFRSTRRSQYRQSTRAGALRLALTPGGYTARFVNVDGVVMDSTSGTCH